jgi:hypothetical protein
MKNKGYEIIADMEWGVRVHLTKSTKKEALILYKMLQDKYKVNCKIIKK